MKILVLNGSPKGEASVTLQSVLYLQKIFKEHTFSVLDVGQKIKAFEKDFSKAKTEIENADVLLFSYPVYTFIAPCQLHRFIELMKENAVDVSGKIATQISTSKHFYDVTAHKYIQDNCEDMGMKYIRGLSADMDDLTLKKGQKELTDFFKHFCWCVENRVFEPVLPRAPKTDSVKVTLTQQAETKKNGEVVIVTDLSESDVQLCSMIEAFRAAFPVQSRVVNLREYPFKGGCLGCFRCATDGKCVYKDGFDEFLRNKIQSSQAIVYAFTIKDHSMGALFKMYDDRQFCNGHRTVTMGMPVGYLVSGNYSVEMNLQMILEGRAQVGGNFLAGVATDEINPDGEIAALAKNLSYAVENKYVQPSNFLGVGGMKIFRDLIYQMRGMMKADHKFYKEHGQYDFPQKKKFTIAMMYLVGAALSSEKVKAKMGNKMTEGMLMPYKNVLNKLDK